MRIRTFFTTAMLFAAGGLAAGSALADAQPMAMPDFSIEKSCSLFNGHPRPLALCLSQESYYREQVTGLWARAPVPGREACAGLAAQSERGKYEVLSRCLRASISEAAVKDAVGTVR